MSVYLAIKEVWRNRGRYLLFSLVIALITILVLFIAALASGLANANKQFIEKLNADLLVFQEDVDLQITSSRLDPSKAKAVRRVDGVADAGLLGLSTANIVFSDGREPIDISLVGVEPGRPGEPELLAGSGLRYRQGKDVIIDVRLAQDAGLSLGDMITVRSIQGTEEEFFNLRVVGITDERRYFFQPSVILPIEAWDEIRPQPARQSASTDLVANVIAVRLQDPSQASQVAQRITDMVSGVDVADKPTTILALPGYTAQQSTLNTQRIFTLLIGVLVVGGFFQIQTLQKVAQIGVLKAIGSSSRVVATSVLMQIIVVTVMGVTIGTLGTLLLSLGLPSNVPIIFSGTTFIAAIAALLLIGPLGGMVSIFLAVKIDPLTAIGLSS